MREKAFTLAEVLITLGIIGIVAAMTLPAIIADYRQKETVSRLKKTYSILNQAVLLAQKDFDLYQYWQTPSEIGKDKHYETYWKPYLKNIKICTTALSCNYSSTTPWVYRNGTPVEVGIAGSTVLRQGIYLADGTFILIGEDNHWTSPTTGQENHFQYIWVDTNGYKPPNMMGKDFFRLIIASNTNKVLADGISSTEENINANCSKDSNGSYCAAKIIKDGWEIKKDYPW